MNIAVAGIGYVGLANAVLLAQQNEVVALDPILEKVRQINRRISPIQDELIETYLNEKPLNLRATADAEEAFSQADFILVCTPTDYDPERRAFETSSVEQVVGQAARMNPDAVIVIKSTVPIGYTKRLSQERHCDRLLFCPEFLREGKALYDNLYPSRILVGMPEDGHLKTAARSFAELLTRSALKREIPTFLMNTTEAEAVKLFANSYLAMRIGFFNELDTYAEVHHLDSLSMIKGVCADPRIGFYYNNPSFGYGGYCLPKDTKQLSANFETVSHHLVKATVETNEARMDFIAQRILQLAQNAVSNPVIGVYRLTMKTESDNLRHSSMAGVVDRLCQFGLRLMIYEPTIRQKQFHGVPVIQNFDEFAQLSTMIIANRKHPQLKSMASKVYSRDLFSEN